VARLFVGSPEGAMLIARSYGDVSRLESAAHHLLGKIRVEQPRAPPHSPRKQGAR
jgi:hypothetical protein